jgi:hypothetical protein
MWEEMVVGGIERERGEEMLRVAGGLKVVGTQQGSTRKLN